MMFIVQVVRVHPPVEGTLGDLLGIEAESFTREVRVCNERDQLDWLAASGDPSIAAVYSSPPLPNYKALDKYNQMKLADAQRALPAIVPLVFK